MITRPRHLSHRQAPLGVGPPCAPHAWPYFLIWAWRAVSACSRCLLYELDYEHDEPCISMQPCETHGDFILPSHVVPVLTLHPTQNLI